MQDDLVHELLIKLQRGNAHAAAVIAALFGQRFYSCARNKYQLSHEDADDVTQTTLKNMIERITTYCPERVGSSRWLWIIFRNVVIDLIRSRKNPVCELTVDLIENGIQDDDDLAAPEVYIEYQELSSVLVQALAQLPEGERKDLLQGRGKAGPKRKSLEKAEQHLRAIFSTLYGA